MVAARSVDWVGKLWLQWLGVKLMISKRQTSHVRPGSEVLLNNCKLRPRPVYAPGPGGCPAGPPRARGARWIVDRALRSRLTQKETDNHSVTIDLHVAQFVMTS